MHTPSSARLGIPQTGPAATEGSLLRYYNFSALHKPLIAVRKSSFYEAPLGYSIEDVRPHGGIKKFRSAAYSNCVRKPS
ncbi:unnamed protein product [Malus baccata var. baccata]